MALENSTKGIQELFCRELQFVDSFPMTQSLRHSVKVPNPWRRNLIGLAGLRFSPLYTGAILRESTIVVSKAATPVVRESSNSCFLQGQRRLSEVLPLALNLEGLDQQKEQYVQSPGRIKDHGGCVELCTPVY